MSSFLERIRLKQQIEQRMFDEAFAKSQRLEAQRLADERARQAELERQNRLRTKALTDSRIPSIGEKMSKILHGNFYAEDGIMMISWNNPSDTENHCLYANGNVDGTVEIRGDIPIAKLSKEEARDTSLIEDALEKAFNNPGRTTSRGYDGYYGNEDG